MTVAHPAPPLQVVDVDEAVTALRDRGLRASAARRVVLQALFTAQQPLTADEIAEGVPGRVPRSDLTSVYRNLETLEEIGLVRHLHVGHGAGLYALSGAEEREYLACEQCGSARVLDAGELDDVRRELHERHGFVASFRHFPIVGLCSNCVIEGAQDASASREERRHA